MSTSVPGYLTFWMDAACCLCGVVVKMCSEVGLQEPKAVSTATTSPRPPNQRVRKGMAFVPQGQQSFGTMTVDENLHVVADRYGSEAKARYDEAVTMFPVLKEFAVERADRYYVPASGRFIATGEGGPAQVEATKEAMRV